MILPRAADHLLLPAKPWFIALSLLLALLLDLLPLERDALRPDVLLLVLVFWSVHQPLRVGMGAAFCSGLLLDVQTTALLGQHALAYVLTTYGAIALRRRLLWFPPWTQAVQILPLLLLSQAVQILVQALRGAAMPDLLVMLAGPVLDAALWPLATVLLLAPQRRPPDRDDTRPL